MLLDASFSSYIDVFADLPYLCRYICARIGEIEMAWQYEGVSQDGDRNSRNTRNIRVAFINEYYDTIVIVTLRLSIMACR